MTTIAYDGKTVAVDSRRCQGSLIISDDVIKYKYQNSKLFFLTGATDECDYFAKNFCAGELCGFKKCGASGILLTDGSVFYVGVDDDVFFACPVDGRKTSCGSGESFALAAMDHKKNAEDAVKYAMTRDVLTGGKVHVFCAKTTRKLK